MVPAQSPELIRSHDAHPLQPRNARHPTRPDSPLLRPPPPHHDLAMDTAHHVSHEDSSLPHHLRPQPDDSPPRPDSPFPLMHHMSTPSHPLPPSNPMSPFQHPPHDEQHQNANSTTTTTTSTTGNTGSTTTHPDYTNELYLQSRPPPDEDLVNVSCCCCCCACSCETHLLLKSCDCGVRLIALICSTYSHSC